MASEQSKDKKPSLLWNSDSVTEMQTNLDDITGEHLAFLMEQLLNDKHCLDVWVTPILMKKGRPAHTLHSLCFPESESAVIELIFRHSTALGVRIYRNVPRAILNRSMVSVQTEFPNSLTDHCDHDFTVGVKVSSFQNGEVVSAKAEFEDCKRVSMATGVPIQVVAHQAVRNAAPGRRETGRLG